jgi:hypothetical protein
MAKVISNKNKSSEQSSEKINHYDINEILDSFNLKRTKNCQTLTDWLRTTPSAFSLAEQEYLELLPQELIEWQYAWNEEELKMNFISLVLRMAHLNEPQKIGLYYERSLSGKVMNKSISVVVDCMVATPKNSGRPDMPYFFMQEFKRTKGDSHDPEGQMLAAMLLAQEMNKDEKAIYGCWLQGKNWNFTTLVGNVYCVSKQFDATQKTDLQEIIFILRKLKDLILQR